MTEKRTLVIHIPVIHRGYLDFFLGNKNKISKIMILDQEIVEKFSDFSPDIAAIGFKEAKVIIGSLGFSNVCLLQKKNIKNFLQKERFLTFINDEVSRKIVSKYHLAKKTEWADIFLRWDKSAIETENEPLEIRVTKEPFAIEMIGRAYREAEKSGDRWRRVGAILARNKKILLKGYNRGLPDEYSACQLGDVRSYFKAGEKPDLYGTIHAEQLITSEAARKGISIKGSDLYVTHFPCPVCAKLIVVSGIRRVYFSEGWSNYLGEKVIKSAKIEIIRVISPSVKK